MTNPITQTFLPGPRLQDGTDLNLAFAQANAQFNLIGGVPLITALTTVGAGTITAAGIVGQVTQRGGAQAGAAFTDTTDTAAAIISALGSTLPVNSAFYWTYENATNAQATLAAGSGVTLTGNVIIPKLTSSRFVVTKTSASAVTIVFFESGVISPLPATSTVSYTGTTATTITPAGMTAAQLAYVALAGSAPAALALDTAVNIIASMPNALPGMSNQVTFLNYSGVTVALTGLTGTIISGTGKIQTLRSQTYNMTVDSAGSVTLTGVATGTLTS